MTFGSAKTLFLELSTCTHLQHLELNLMYNQIEFEYLTPDMQFFTALSTTTSFLSSFSLKLAHNTKIPFKIAIQIISAIPFTSRKVFSCHLDFFWNNVSKQEERSAARKLLKSKYLISSSISQPYYYFNNY